MKLLRPMHFWCLAFTYSVAAALVLQKLVLPLIPSLHAGHGLLVSDATVFHDVAVALAERINAGGWSEWKLFPAEGMTGNVSLLGALYAVFGPEPALFIPFNAAAHAFSGTLIYMLGMLLWPGRVGRFDGAIAGLLFICFPSSLQWYGQNHKDSFSIAGTLLILYSLLSMSELGLMQKKAWLKGAALCASGALLVTLVRPYYLLIVLVGFSVATVAWCVSGGLSARRLASRYVLYGLLLVTVVASAVIEAPRDRNLVGGEAAAQINGSDVSIVIRQWQWHPASLLPEKIDLLFERVSRLRLGFIAYGIEVGAGSQIDSDRAPASALEVAAYMPRAMVVGLFAPFPSTWTEKQTLPRLIGAVETCIFYMAVIGMLGLVSRKPDLKNLASGAVFALVLIMVLAYVHPNVGTLYRQRYGLWFFFMLCGCVGWMGLGQRFWQMIRPAHIESGTDSRRKAMFAALPQLAVSSMAIVLITATSYLGFMVRDLILVKDYGIGGQLDSFFLAAMLPMFLVTALSLPLSDAMTAQFMGLEPEDRSRFGRSVLGFVSVILFVVGACFAIFAEPIIVLIGSLPSQASAHEAASMLRWFLLILVFAGWTAVGNAILNAVHQPRVVAVGQAVVPLATVIFLLACGEALGVMAAIYGMLLGFAINVALVAVAVQRLGIRMLPAWPDLRMLAPTLSKYYRLCCVALLTAASVPLNYYFAATLEHGSVTTWALGSKMIQLVTGLAAITIGSIILPHFSVLYRHKEEKQLGEDMYFLLLAGTWLAVFIALLTQVFADPLVLALFQGGEVSTEAALHLAAILRLGSLQLPFVIATTLIIKLLAVSGFTTRPVLASIAGVALNVLLNLLWVDHYGVLGLTMAMVVAAAAPALYLVCFIRVRCGMKIKQVANLFCVWLGLGVLTAAMNIGNGTVEILALALLLSSAYMQWRQLSRGKAFLARSGSV